MLKYMGTRPFIWTTQMGFSKSFKIFFSKSVKWILMKLDIFLSDDRHYKSAKSHQKRRARFRNHNQSLYIIRLAQT